MPRTLAQEILVLLDEPGADRSAVTIGQLSRRLGVSSALTRLCARQLVADGAAAAIMVEHAGMTTIQALTRISPPEPAGAAKAPPPEDAGAAGPAEAAGPPAAAEDSGR